MAPPSVSTLYCFLPLTIAEIEMKRLRTLRGDWDNQQFMRPLWARAWHFKRVWPGCLVWMQTLHTTWNCWFQRFRPELQFQSDKDSLSQILSIWGLELTGRASVKYSKCNLSSSVSHLGWLVSLDCHCGNCQCVCLFRYDGSVITVCSFKSTGAPRMTRQHQSYLVAKNYLIISEWR